MWPSVAQLATCSFLRPPGRAPSNNLMFLLLSWCGGGVGPTNAMVASTKRKRELAGGGFDPTDLDI